MSTPVTTEFFARPGRGDDVASLLIEILGQSLQHDGCKIIRIVRDQDDPDHVAGVTQWTERHNYDDYPRGVRSKASPVPSRRCCPGRSSFTATTSRMSATASLQSQPFSTDLRARSRCHSNQLSKAAPFGRRVAAPLPGDLVSIGQVGEADLLREGEGRSSCQSTLDHSDKACAARPWW
jgi:quinol monooxygenase YgiN